MLAEPFLLLQQCRPPYEPHHTTVSQLVVTPTCPVSHPISPPTPTQQKLYEAIQKSKPHKYTPSCKAKHGVDDQVVDAMHLLMMKKEVVSIEDEELADGEADDLIAD